MTDQTPSGNRWEPTEPNEAGAPAVTPASAPPTETPPPAPAVPERPGRWRTLLRGPGRQAWLAAGVAALVVFAGSGGFLAGRASVDDDPDPTEVGQQWRHGPGDGELGELPPRPFDRGGDEDREAPGGAPGTSS